MLAMTSPGSLTPDHDPAPTWERAVSFRTMVQLCAKGRTGRGVRAAGRRSHARKAAVACRSSGEAEGRWGVAVRRPFERCDGSVAGRWSGP